MEHSKHIWRVAFLLICLLLVMVVIRHFLIPPSFGESGFFRYDAVAEIAAQEPIHGRPGACGECHDEIAAAKAGGEHAPVSCEVCHGPLASHVAEGEVIAPMAINRSYQLCAYCHQRLKARPQSIVQIDLHEHLDLARDQAIPLEACLECHDTEGIHAP